ncbi:MAG: hypothetical protein H6Q68_2111 [Firmicutes bacterium]|nr:hypothetical protein [Bacillota bacterium]
MGNNTIKTALGLTENIEAFLCYIFGWLTGVIFLILERENSFVRFHAMQSLTTFLSLFIISMIAGSIPILGWILTILITPTSVILWLFLMYKAYRGEKYKLPIIGIWAEQQINKYPI